MKFNLDREQLINVVSFNLFCVGDLMFEDGVSFETRRNTFEVASYISACYLAQNTVMGKHGVEGFWVLEEVEKETTSCGYSYNVIRRVVERLVSELGGMK